VGNPQRGISGRAPRASKGTNHGTAYNEKKREQRRRKKKKKKKKKQKGIKQLTAPREGRRSDRRWDSKHNLGKGKREKTKFQKKR